MATTVELLTQEQLLGDLVRYIRNNTDLTDVAPGSDLAILLEAFAAAGGQLSLGNLKILQSTNLEALTGSDLHKKAESIKLPNGIGGVGAKPSSQASGLVTIGSAFQKISSKLYAGKPAPYAGSNKLFVENAGSFPATGSIYIGRGTLDRFEGPIPYTSATNDGTFWTISLSAALTKSHLASDLVVLAQGGDRTVGSGTTVQVPPSTESPAISYTTTQALVIPDGESEGVVNAVCTQFGEVGNALKGAISQFASQPFAGATVTNTSSFQNGRSTESDEDLRQRIKNYPATLSRGVKAAIQAAIQGASDPETGKTITSSNILDPVEPGDFSRVFIDDSTGLEPTFGSQAYELLLQAASGQEKDFRVAQFPITAATAEGANFAPYVINASMTITVTINETTEVYQITPSNYANLNSATAYEIVRDLNAQSNIVGWRTLENGTRIVCTDLSGIGETLKIDVGDLQSVLGLPTATLRPVFLYKNSEIQSFRGQTASLKTRARNTWSLSEADLENVLVVIDGVQLEITITNADFALVSANINTATVAQWATVLSSKIPGVKFTPNGQVLTWSTYQTFSPNGTLEIPEFKLDGTPAGWVGSTKIWQPTTLGGVLSAVGRTKDYKFNRFTGELSFLSKPAAGSKIEVGSRATYGHIKSVKAASGLFGLAPLTFTIGNSRLILGFDGDFAVRERQIAAGDTLTPTLVDAVNFTNLLRFTASSTTFFAKGQVGDFFYLSKHAVLTPTWTTAQEAIYRIKTKGLQKSATNIVANGLSAIGTAFTNATTSVTLNKNTVVVTISGHGLASGDLISVSTATAIGGISGANLSVTNAPITVLSENKFQYTALDTATVTANGSIANIGTNIIEVTMTGHGYASGGLITTTVTTGFAGISDLDLSVTAQPIEVLSTNILRYRAVSANATFPLPAGGTITSLTYLADTWVECEVSTPQMAAWTPFLGLPQNMAQEMLYLFRSTVHPQIVDFGNVSVLTVDQVVAAINASIATGAANKLTPQQFEIKSSDLTSGSVAVLASIGNSSNMISADVSSAQQAHTGHSISSYSQSGFAVVQSIILPTTQAAGYFTRTYLSVDKDLSNIPSAGVIQSDLFVTDYPEGYENTWLTGQQAGYTARVYNNQTSAPYTGIYNTSGIILPLATSDTTQTSPGSVDNYSNYSIRLRDLSFNNFDKLVFEFDLDPTDKTVAIAMAKKAAIEDIDALTGSGKGQVISFLLKDPEDANKPFFDLTSVYRDFDFRDFKLLTKSVGLYREDVSDRALILRSTNYGADHRLKMIVTLPTVPDQPEISVAHLNRFDNSETALNLLVTLPSQNLILNSVLGVGTYKVTSAASATLFDWRVSSGQLNAASTYAVGNVLNISGASELAGSYKIIAATYNTWATAVATTSNGSNVVSVAQTGHGYINGDIVDITAGASIGGISAPNLSGSFVITYVDANTFTYVATGTSPVAGGTIDTVTRPNITLLTPSAAVSNGSPTVTVTSVGHGLQTGNLINTLAQSIVLSASSASVTSGFPTVTVTSVGHGLLTGDVVTVTTSTAIGGISSTDLSPVHVAIIKIDNNTFTYDALANASSNDSGTIDTVETGIGGISGGNLSVTGASITRIDANTFTYAASSSALANASGLLTSAIRPVSTYTVVTALTTSGSSLIQLTQAAHGFQNNDIVAVSTIAAIGGLSGGNLSVPSATITVLDANTFTYNASASAPANFASLASVSGGSVTVKAPGSGGLAPSAIYSASVAPVKSWAIANKTLTDLATAITAYYPTFPVATGDAIGSNLATTFMALPTYMVYPNAVAYSGPDIVGAFFHHAFNTQYAGSAGIFQYDSSNDIKATVQASESIFPTTTQAAGTSYSPIDEIVYLVPTNTKTLSAWLSFKASSSLNLLANIDRIQKDNQLQISSRADGSSGAVRVTGVTANNVATSVIQNASNDNNSIKLQALTADVKSIPKGSAVKITNTVHAELQRPYRAEPSGASITLANTPGVNVFFRDSTAIKYVRVNSNTGRLIFYRSGMNTGQTESLDAGNDITFANLGAGLVQVTSDIGTGGVGTGKLSARTGDMMYIQPSSVFTNDQECKEIESITDGDEPEYLGFPVVHVIDDNNILILAPSITTFNTVTLGTSTDLVFLPAIWNEKNIRTNYQEGHKFSELTGNEMYYLIKTLGNGFVSVWAQNSTSESTDDMLLDNMSVSTDDFAVFGVGFDPENQGTFRIVAHNGKNHLLIYNPNGGKDELIDANTVANGGLGERKWRVGPLPKDSRQLKILDGEAVRIKDYVRISAPSATTLWFNDTFFGSWVITKMGYQALDYTGFPLPHTPASGVFDKSQICPYIDFEFPNAPLAVLNSSNLPIDTILLGDNARSIGFAEQEPFSAMRLVMGHAVSPLNPENSEIFVAPELQSGKMSAAFGTILTSMSKAGYPLQTFQGIDGYKVYTGLIREAHRIVDGLPTNSVLYPSVKAVGTFIEFLAPLLRSISVSLQVRPKDGITLNSLTELLKSTVGNYINRLDVGKPVVLSEIIRRVQSLPGVFSVKILSTAPVADDDRIVTADNEKAVVINISNDITIG